MATPAYEVRIDTPGVTWRIVHRLPDSTKTYFVRRGPTGLSCSCPGFRFGRKCKHCSYVAGLLGQPTLDPATPF